MPSKSELREHMLACAALRYKVGLVYHGNAAETGEYLYDPNYTPTRDIEQVVHTLSAMFKACGYWVVSPHSQGLQGSHLNLIDQRAAPYEVFPSQ